MKRNRIKIDQTILFSILASLYILACLVSCDNSKERNKLMKEPNYSSITDSLPFTFEKSDIAEFTSVKQNDSTVFCNLKYKIEQANLYCTYHTITPEQFPSLAEDTYKLAYCHAIVAKSIDKQTKTREDGSGAIIYDIKGDVATPIQIAITDSSSYFFNASLYFDNGASCDTISDVIEYIRKDIVHLVDTFHNKQ